GAVGGGRVASVSRCVVGSAARLAPRGHPGGQAATRRLRVARLLSADQAVLGRMETTTGRLEPRLTGYADVNGLHMYYEVHGAGSPLVLLHGGMLTIDLNFAALIPALARAHQVIGVEMQGHGRTADIDREITPAALASD